jgi:uncharacterized protein YciI
MRYFAVVRQPGPGWDPTLPMAEQRLWGEHAAFVNTRAEEGFIVLGGPFGGDGAFLLIIRALDEEEVRRGFDDDPWAPLTMLTITSVEPWAVTTGKEDLLESFHE